MQKFDLYSIMYFHVQNNILIILYLTNFLKKFFKWNHNRKSVILFLFFFFACITHLNTFCIENRSCIDRDCKRFKLGGTSAVFRRSITIRLEPPWHRGKHVALSFRVDYYILTLIRSIHGLYSMSKIQLIFG